MMRSACLTRVALTRVDVHLLSSHLRVAFCTPQCVLVQTLVIHHGELRRLGILQCDHTFQGLF